MAGHAVYTPEERNTREERCELPPVEEEERREKKKEEDEQWEEGRNENGGKK